MTNLNQLQNLDIEQAIQAVIADDPDMASLQEDLRLSLQQAKAGQFGRTTRISNIAKSSTNQSAITQTRQKAGLSQSQFANMLGVSVETLQAWEQGDYHPDGSANVLLKLLDKRPELIAELG